MPHPHTTRLITTVTALRSELFALLARVDEVSDLVERPTAGVLREIGALKERGYSCAEIALRADLHVSYVKGIVRLLTQEETRLLEAVESGQILISIAVTIATSDDQEVQRVFAEAYLRDSGCALRVDEVSRSDEDALWKRWHAA